MILLDDEEQQQPKLRPYSTQASRNPEDAPGPGREHLPDYESSQQAQLTQLQRRINQEEDQDEIELQKQKAKAKSWRLRWFMADARFWRATLYALIIYLIITVAVGVPLIVTQLRHHLRHKPPNPPDDTVPATLIDLPIFDSLNSNCNTWRKSGGDQQTASVSYTFPSDSSIYLRSNVSQDMNSPKYVTGSLLVDVNSDESQRDMVLSVVLGYTDEQFLKRTNVCVVGTGGGEGISINVPGNLTQANSLTFNITLLFPRTYSVAHINEFLTFLPVFSQSIGDLQPFYTFDAITIEGPMSSIDVKSVQGKEVVMKSSLASISGTFNTSDTITLDTIAAPISANVALNHDEKLARPTRCHISTGNGALSANVTVLETTPSVTAAMHPPQFVTDFTTFNGPLLLSFKHDAASPPTHIHLRVNNNLDSARVTLDPKYEGTFDVMTKFADATVLEDTADPGSGSEERNLEYDVMSSARKVGWTGWGSRPKSAWARREGQGRVEIVSSLSPVTLDLGGGT